MRVAAGRRRRGPAGDLLGRAAAGDGTTCWAAGRAARRGAGGRASGRGEGRGAVRRAGYEWFLPERERRELLAVAPRRRLRAAVRSRTTGEFAARRRRLRRCNRQAELPQTARNGRSMEGRASGRALSTVGANGLRDFVIGKHQQINREAAMVRSRTKNDSDSDAAFECGEAMVRSDSAEKELGLRRFGVAVAAREAALG